MAFGYLVSDIYKRDYKLLLNFKVGSNKVFKR